MSIDSQASDDDNIKIKKNKRDIQDDNDMNEKLNQDKQKKIHQQVNDDLYNSVYQINEPITRYQQQNNHTSSSVQLNKPIRINQQESGLMNLNKLGEHLNKQGNELMNHSRDVLENNIRGEHTS